MAQEAMESPKHEQWKGTTGGTKWMQQSLVFFLGWMNLPVFYAIMAFVIPFYMIFNRQGYLSQYHFFHLRLGYNPISSFFHVYFNQFTFGQIILDRFAVYGGSNFKVEIEGNPLFLDRIEKPEGFMQLSSHVGNFELAGYMLKQQKKVINALIFGGETGTVMENRQRIMSQMNIKLIPVTTDMSHVYAMNTALEEGQIVSMPGDRIFGSQKSVTCDFFGAKAQFPMGPYIMAASRDVPLLSIFVMKESLYKYRIFVNEVNYPDELKGKPARVRAAALAQSFANQLESVVRKHPHQWFNYYEFWA